jgi:hypothetical protein
VAAADPLYAHAKPSDAQPSDAQPSDAQPSDAQPSDAQPSDAQLKKKILNTFPTIFGCFVL